jgi:hypothetical protein
MHEIVILEELIVVGDDKVKGMNVRKWVEKVDDWMQRDFY